jgi:hypothetical protein
MEQAHELHDRIFDEFYAHTKIWQESKSVPEAITNADIVASIAIPDAKELVTA